MERGLKFFWMDNRSNSEVKSDLLFISPSVTHRSHSQAQTDKMGLYGVNKNDDIYLSLSLTLAIRYDRSRDRGD